MDLLIFCITTMDSRQLDLSCNLGKSMIFDLPLVGVYLDSSHLGLGPGLWWLLLSAPWSRLVLWTGVSDPNLTFVRSCDNPLVEVWKDNQCSRGLVVLISKVLFSLLVYFFK